MDPTGRMSKDPEWDEQERPFASRLTDHGPIGRPSSDGRIMIRNGFDHKDIQLIFPVHNFFMLGSPLAMFVSCYFEETYIRAQLPTVEHFFNVYHPSDLIAYRVEPLIKQHDYTT